MGRSIQQRFRDRAMNRILWFQTGPTLPREGRTPMKRMTSPPGPDPLEWIWRPYRASLHFWPENGHGFINPPAAEGCGNGKVFSNFVFLSYFILDKSFIL